jgi:hypothetical protein
MRPTGIVVPVLAFILLAAAADAPAYVGPGAGITMLGSLWLVVLFVLFIAGATLFLPIWILVRRCLESRRTQQAADRVERIGVDAEPEIERRDSSRRVRTA